MRLKSQIEAQHTREKLARLEEEYERARKRQMDTPELHQLALYSLRRMINQMKEELIRFECDVKSGRMPAATVEM